MKCGSYFIFLNDTDGFYRLCIALRANVFLSRYSNNQFIIGYSLWLLFKNATLNRFLSLHYLFPFVLVALAIIHLIALHEDGSNNPIGVKSESDKGSFHYYYVLKDLYGGALLGIILGG